MMRSYEGGHVSNRIEAMFWHLLNYVIPRLGECKIEEVHEHSFNAITNMPPSYDLIIEEDGRLKTIEIFASNKESAVNKWDGEKGSIRGIVFNEKNYKDD